MQQDGHPSGRSLSRFGAIPAVAGAIGGLAFAVLTATAAAATATAASAAAVTVSVAFALDSGCGRGAFAFGVAHRFAVALRRLVGRRRVVSILGGRVGAILALGGTVLTLGCAIVAVASAAPPTTAPAATAAAVAIAVLVARSALALAFALDDVARGGGLDFLGGLTLAFALDVVVGGARQLLCRSVVAALAHALDLAVGGVQLVVGLDGDLEGVALLDLAQRRGASC